MTKKEVLRTCLCCRKEKDKKDLFRIVREKDGTISLDKTYKKNGRGAYISKEKSCIEDKKLIFKLQHALKVKFTEESFRELLDEIKGELNE